MNLLGPFLGILSVVLWGVTPAWSLVTPEEVVVIANRNLPESLDLGNNYLARRNIPQDHLIALDLPTGESITRNEYIQFLSDPLRAELKRRSLDAAIRVLVTIWGVPLIVNGAVSTSEEETWTQDAKDWSDSAKNLLEEHDRRLTVWLYPENRASLSPSLPEEESVHKSLIGQGKLSEWKQQVTQVMQEIQRRLETTDDIDQKNAGIQMVEKTRHRIFGRYGWPEVSGKNPSAQSEPTEEELVVRNIMMSLLQNPTAAKREKVYEVVQEGYGLLGIVTFANWEMKRYRHEESHASVDSELAMLWWEPGTYPLAGRIPNPWYMTSSPDVQWPYPVLMVSRLDAPTVEIATSMIDRAIATDGKGLTGNIYVDARGLKGGRPSSYAHYDHNLREFAQEMTGIPGMKVILENTEQRFSQPGQAPDVSLYVGWYRLRNYEDAFTFQPGAIGYHIASGEAVSLHNQNERGWCKNALEHGITVTLGPVREPYLTAFPLPTEFFGLIYSGQYSLVEAFALSSRYLSWQMVLLGDPLYRPWKGNDPDRKKTALTLLNRKELPTAPTEGASPDPSRNLFESPFPGKYLMLDPHILKP